MSFLILSSWPRKGYHVCLFCKSSNCCPMFNLYTTTRRSILQKLVLIQYCKADCSFLSTGLLMFLLKSILLLQTIFQFVILNSVSSLIHFHIVINVRSGSIMTRLSLDPSLKIFNKTGCGIESYEIPVRKFFPLVMCY